MPRVGELIVGVRQAYKPFAPATGSSQPTDTLITKVILGTFGCLPACDRYFIDGFKSQGLKYSHLNDTFVERILGFCHEHLPELQKEQAGIEESGGLHYPLMKLADMYFWQLGHEGALGRPEGSILGAVVLGLRGQPVGSRAEGQVDVRLTGGITSTIGLGLIRAHDAR